VLALKPLQGNSDSASYNLETGNGFSVRDVIQTVSAVTRLAKLQSGDGLMGLHTCWLLRDKLGREGNVGCRGSRIPTSCYHLTPASQVRHRVVGIIDLPQHTYSD
jgi:hypothetical protein